MVLVKILGILDIIIAILILITIKFTFIPRVLILIAGVYLLIKGIMFAVILDAASILDVIASIIIILSLYISMPPLIMIIVVIYLLQKKEYLA